MHQTKFSATKKVDELPCKCVDEQSRISALAMYPLSAVGESFSIVRGADAESRHIPRFSTSPPSYLIKMTLDPR